MRIEYSVYEAKAKLSEILRLVKRHREVTITERGRKVARVVPCGDDENEALEDRIRRLRERGAIRPARTSPSDAFAKLAPRRKPGALKRFLKDRE